MLEAMIFLSGENSANDEERPQLLDKCHANVNTMV